MTSIPNGFSTDFSKAPDDERLGKRIGLAAKATRKARGLTLQDVADRSGLAKSYVWEIERGEKTNPSISALVSLAGALGCSLDDLVGAKKFMKPTLRPEAMRIAVQVDELLRAALASHKDYVNEDNEVARVFILIPTPGDDILKQLAGEK